MPATQDEIMQLLAAQLYRIQSERAKQEEIRDCTECGGSGIASNGGTFLAVCPTCEGQKMIIVIT
jgi:DnaJ-class molecular chaperone